MVILNYVFLFLHKRFRLTLHYALEDDSLRIILTLIRPQKKKKTLHISMFSSDHAAFFFLKKWSSEPIPDRYRLLVGISADRSDHGLISVQYET